MAWNGGSSSAYSHPTYHHLSSTNLGASRLNNYSTAIGTRGAHDYGYSGSRFAVSQAKQPLVRPVLFRSVNVAPAPSANIRWASADAVNFMDHLYFITNLVLDYLLDNNLPQELMNQTLLDDPLSVLSEHRNELITHFHKLLIAACACLCIGISIPLFGFMIACCWCSGGNKSSTSKRSSSARHHRYSSNRSGARSTSRSRGNHGSSDTDWLALAARDSSSNYDRNGHYRAGGSRHHREMRRQARSHRRSNEVPIINGSSSNYRSRSMPPSLKYETTCHPCLRTFFSSNLFMVLLLISFFSVCAFVTNEYVNNGVKQLPRALNQSVDEIQIYLNNTDHEVDNLFKVNFIQLENEINLRLDTSGVIIKHKLSNLSEAVALVNLTDIVSELTDTKTRLEKIDHELHNLKVKLNTAGRGLNDVRQSIEKCPPDICTPLRTKYQILDNFRILPRYDKLPDVKNHIKKVSQLIERGIVKEVMRGRTDFEKFSGDIQNKVNQAIPEIKTHLSNLGKRLASLATDVDRTIRWSDQLFNQTRSNAKKLNQYADYENYRRYTCLAAASVILFILLCYTLGWLYGSCRPQPTARTYKTRVKTSASASFPFSCGIFTVFLLFLPMILGAIVLFMTGSIGDRIVCHVIKHPEQKQSKQIFAMLQNKFLGGNLSISSPEEDKISIERIEGKDYKVYRPNYADLFSRCHQNLSIYKVLKLDLYDKVYLTEDGQGKKVTVSIDRSFYSTIGPELKGMGNLDAKLRDFRALIKLDNLNVVLLTEQAENLAKSLTNLSFEDLESSFNSLYDHGVTISPIDIEALIKDIHYQKAQLQNHTDQTLESELNWAIMAASLYADQLLPNITNSLLNLKESVRHLKLRVFHGRNNFGAVINELVAKIRNAEIQLRNNGNNLVKQSAEEFTDELNALVIQYKNHVRSQVENVIGQCEPFSRALNSTTSTLCDDIILPFNGYWLSASAALILILPATFLAYALRGLFKLAKRGPPSHHNYNYTDQEDEISYEDDGENTALAYHLGHHSHLTSLKPSSSSAAPSAPLAVDDGWSPTSPSYAHNPPPPPYAV